MLWALLSGGREPKPGMRVACSWQQLPRWVLKQVRYLPHPPASSVSNRVSLLGMLRPKSEFQWPSNLGESMVGGGTQWGVPGLCWGACHPCIPGPLENDAALGVRTGLASQRLSQVLGHSSDRGRRSTEKHLRIESGVLNP